jgi:hypothetical protein
VAFGIGTRRAECLVDELAPRLVAAEDALALELDRGADQSRSTVRSATLPVGGRRSSSVSRGTGRPANARVSGRCSGMSSTASNWSASPCGHHFSACWR